ncbi:MAG: hypothetical protein P8X98_13240 [Woeseiaceae bacterium]
MRLRRPRSLNGLILVGLGFVALPLLLAAIWALVNLDRVAEQSEQLMTTSAAAAEYSQSLDEQHRTRRDNRRRRAPDRENAVGPRSHG